MPGRRPSSTTRLGDSVLRGNGSCQRIKQGPLTATLSWRPGPTWTAKVDHLPTAANTRNPPSPHGTAVTSVLVLVLMRRLLPEGEPIA